MTFKKQKIEGQTLDTERALYGLKKAEVRDCVFAGPADGESALKECRDITVKNCTFSLRYPLWHDTGFRLTDSRLDEKTRAPIWYSRKGTIENTEITGVKCLRECHDISLYNVKAVSPEFGWKCRGLKITDSVIESEYVFMSSEKMQISGLKLKGKYSFQYCKGVRISDSELETKDAFWHAKNVTVENSVIRGEYLGWYSEGLTLIGCRIIGTQPLCYCKNLTLINCEMENTDLSFEYSDVKATINGNVVSVKNPKSGEIIADSFGGILFTDDAVYECKAKVITKKP